MADLQAANLLNQVYCQTALEGHRSLMQLVRCYMKVPTRHTHVPSLKVVGPCALAIPRSSHLRA